MKKIAIGLSVVVVAALAVVGFGPKYSNEDLMAKLMQSWDGHSERDLEFQETFFDLAVRVATENEHVREKFASYKASYNIKDDSELLQKIFLLRRVVDKDSFYAGMEKWNSLSEETQAKVIAKFGPTYKAVANGSLEDNQKLVDILAKRKTNLAGVVSALPVEFRDVVATLEPTEVDDYTECLYLMLLNTVAVRNFTGQTEAVKVNTVPGAPTNDKQDL